MTPMTGKFLSNDLGDIVDVHQLILLYQCAVEGKLWQCSDIANQ
jgi:hypothetical protein